ncbi:MAG TPA: 30S ribosomal protein S20 [Hyphomicrobiaceae bacterium]|nr:30S ribosomal protein S20 [Hyphomicrobiaceae bacterium]
MANTSSAKKAARQAIRRTEVNKSRRTRLRSELRRVEEAIAAGDQAVAAAALRAAQPVIMRSGQLGVVHTNNASRKVSRLTKRVKLMAADANA